MIDNKKNKNCECAKAFLIENYTAKEASKILSAIDFQIDYIAALAIVRLSKNKVIKNINTLIQYIDGFKSCFLSIYSFFERQNNIYEANYEKNYRDYSNETFTQLPSSDFSAQIMLTMPYFEHEFEHHIKKTEIEHFAEKTQQNNDVVNKLICDLQLN